MRPRLVKVLDATDPDVIFHAAAISAADAVFRNPAEGWAVNVAGTRALAAWCRDHDRRLVFTSTDLVFDGARSWYREDDEVAPDPGIRPDQGRRRAGGASGAPRTGRSNQPALRPLARRARVLLRPCGRGA